MEHEDTGPPKAGEASQAAASREPGWWLYTSLSHGEQEVDRGPAWPAVLA